MTELLQRKALYNLIQLHLLQEKNKELGLEPWQTANYREFPTDILLEKLSSFELPLEETNFESAAAHFDTPEEMAERLSIQLPPQTHDRVYLLVFELWRRFLPEKQSLSIFCDEIDFQILAYENGSLSSLREIQTLIDQLHEILDENLDAGGKPEEVFFWVQTYAATDLESFLYDYILDQIEIEELAYGQELLDDFYPYLLEKPWFDYLKARIEIANDPEEGYHKLHALIEGEIPAKSLELNLEILFFLSTDPTVSLFRTLSLASLPLLETEEDFQELTCLAACHYHTIGNEAAALEVESLRKAREIYSPEAPLLTQAKELERLKKILTEQTAF